MAKRPTAQTDSIAMTEVALYVDVSYRAGAETFCFAIIGQMSDGTVGRIIRRSKKNVGGCDPERMAIKQAAECNYEQVPIFSDTHHPLATRVPRKNPYYLLAHFAANAHRATKESRKR